MITIVAAKSQNNIIGKDNDLAWYLPNDLKHFKAITSGHPIIMGRKTFDSIVKPLPNRANIVVTRNPDWTADGVIVTHSLEEAISKAQEIDEEIFIIGGGKIFEEAMPLTEALEMTVIYKDFDGDTSFPEIDSDTWKEVSKEEFKADEKNQYDYAFVRYERR